MLTEVVSVVIIVWTRGCGQLISRLWLMSLPGGVMFSCVGGFFCPQPSHFPRMGEVG